jgi:hypothetical protein
VMSTITASISRALPTWTIVISLSQNQACKDLYGSEL